MAWQVPTSIDRGDYPSLVSSIDQDEVTWLNHKSVSVVQETTPSRCPIVVTDECPLLAGCEPSSVDSRSAAGRTTMLICGPVAVTCRARPPGYDEDGMSPISPFVFSSRAVRQAHAGFDARGEKHGCSTA